MPLTDLTALRTAGDSDSAVSANIFHEVVRIVLGGVIASFHSVVQVWVSINSAFISENLRNGEHFSNTSHHASSIRTGCFEDYDRGFT